MEIRDDSTIERTKTAVDMSLDDGIVMMDVQSGNYYDLNRVGGRIWTMLEQPQRLDAICQGLRKTFDVPADTCRSQTIAFLNDLHHRGLVRIY